MACQSLTADKFVVRMPDGMREQITQVAHDNNRSMNSEIIERLQKSLETHKHRFERLESDDKKESELLTMFRELDDESKAAILLLTFKAM